MIIHFIIIIISIASDYERYIVKIKGFWFTYVPLVVLRASVPNNLGEISCTTFNNLRTCLFWILTNVWILSIFDTSGSVFDEEFSIGGVKCLVRALQVRFFISFQNIQRSKDDEECLLMLMVNQPINFNARIVRDISVPRNRWRRIGLLLRLVIC